MKKRAELIKELNLFISEVDWDKFLKFAKKHDIPEHRVSYEYLKWNTMRRYMRR